MLCLYVLETGDGRQQDVRMEGEHSILDESLLLFPHLAAWIDHPNQNARIT